MKVHRYLLVALVITSASLFAVAQTTERNGKIAFVHRDQNMQKIYVMNSDGTERTKLSDGYWDSWPVWSPDGTKIAFKRKPTKDSVTDLYVMNADGQNEKLLAHDVEFQDPPAWSPDGSKIAFASQRERDKSCSICWSSIHVIDADGCHEVQLTGVRFFSHPTWSPDGKRIAFVDNGSLLLMDANGSNQVVLLKIHQPYLVSSASWSPDGREILFFGFEAFNDESGISKSRATIRAISPVAGVSKARLVNYGEDPVWSPDGTKVVFNRGTQLFVMDASGANPKPLGDAQGGADFQPAWGTAAAQTAKN
jgi:Tol biopolymer transport system component